MSDFITDRRAFLIGSAAAAAASTLAAAAEPEVRAAFIGVGGRGSRLLGQTLEIPGARVSAICDIDPGARDAALSAAARDRPKGFSNWQEVVDMADVDAVKIATPCHLHAEMAAACLRAGKYVYCEKPLGVTPEDVQLVLDAARKSSAFLQIGQQLRYFPSVRAAIERIHDDALTGRRFVIKAQRHGTPRRPEDEAGRPPRPAWYDDVSLSGDLIVENSVHNLDICNWIAGSRPVSAYGRGKKYLPEPRPAGSVMMDGFSVEYIYENGMHLDYSQLYLHPRGLENPANGQWYVVFAEHGAVEMSHSSARFLEMHGESEPLELVPGEVRERPENAMSEFSACVREKRTPFADVKIGATAALTAILGREAIYRGRSVDWTDLGVEV